MEKFNNINENKKELDETSTNHLIYSCLKVSSIQNKDKVLYKNLLCCVCLEIAMNPNECSNCEILICGCCSDMLKINGKICIRDKCKEIKKANKFAREMLSQIIVICSFCSSKETFTYDQYQEHLKTCSEFKSVKIFDLLKKASEVENIFLEKAAEKVKIKNQLLVEERRKNKKIQEDSTSYIQVSSYLNPSQKMELYQATLDGDINSFKTLVIDKKYPIFEEVSAQGFKWATLHYAMHYGKENIIFFIFDILSRQNLLSSGLNSRSSDGRCPILCLLKSNTLDSVTKKSIMKKILKNYSFNLSEDVCLEINRRGMDELIIKYRT